MRKMWQYKLLWFSQKIRRFYYDKVHGIKIGIDDSMLPKLGKGKYISVYRKGDYIEIVSEVSGEKIRLIPYQPNHGVMVEHVYRDGTTGARHHMNFNWFLQELCINQEIEKLENKEETV